MKFIETGVFTRIINGLMSDDEYRAIQTALISKPDLGAIIKGTNGIRKFRWKQGNSGKRGGARFIYYWQVSEDTFYMLYAYTKNQQADLTESQKKVLAQLVKKELYNG